MSGVIDRTTTTPKSVVLIVANPTVSPTLGWPVGFWASEVTHPYYAFVEAGYTVTLASPTGGQVVMDAYSDPRHESGYSADDLISMGFIHTPKLAALLDDTHSLSDINVAEYDAVVVCGGQSPMFTFREQPPLQQLLQAFYEAEKPVAALCHGVAALIDVTLTDGTYLIAGKTMTGFANIEEDAAAAAVGLIDQRMFPWTIEDAARERGANYIQGGLWKAFAVRDGRLITGQQQYSGAAVARLVIAALGT